MKIIAEVGSNWKTLDDCIMSIEKAKEAGANIVKFQLFSHFDLYGTINADIPGITPNLDVQWLPVLKECAMDNEIEFMCTGFSVSRYNMIDPFVYRHKIASAEMTDINILERLNNIGKPVVMSTAGSSLDEIKSALNYLRRVPVTIMFCVGDYPAKIIDFRRLEQMKNYLGDNYSYGYSDHSLDVLNIPKIAKDYGCVLIEKHVNFTIHKDTNDANHSLNFEEFKLMCAMLRGESLSILDTENYANILMKKQYKRRFIATKEINIGDKFLIDYNVGIYRSNVMWHDPVSTFNPCDLFNQISITHKRPGDVISYADFERD